MKPRHLFVMAMLAALAVNSVRAQSSESLYAGDPDGASGRTFTSEEYGGASMTAGPDATPGPYGTDYLGVDDFFRVREANPNIKHCVWQFELNTAWQTFRNGSGRDDDWNVGASIKYGISDDVFAEFEVLPVNLGDGNGFRGYGNDRGFFGDNKGGGDSGNGESNLKLFWRFLREQEVMPAMAVWSELRLPTGAGSAKLDWNVHLNMTKTIVDRLRAHLTGWAETANGSRGDFDDGFFGDRRDFQWGFGTGVDYSLNEQNLLVLNYENRSSNYDGNANTNHYEAGWVHHLTETQQLMVSAIYDDVRGEQEGPRWTAQFQWSVAF